MSWAGHVADMIGRIKYNNSLKESYRARHKRIKKAFINEYAKHNVHLRPSQDIPKEELEKIRTEIKRKLIRERRIALIKTLSVSIIVFIFILYFIFKYFIPFIL